MQSNLQIEPYTLCMPHNILKLSLTTKTKHAPQRTQRKTLVIVGPLCGLCGENILILIGDKVLV